MVQFEKLQQFDMGFVVNFHYGGTYGENIYNFEMS